MPHTAEEIWQHLYPEHASVHLEVLPETQPWAQAALSEGWRQLQSIRKAVDTQLEQLRQDKAIGGNLMRGKLGVTTGLCAYRPNT